MAASIKIAELREKSDQDLSGMRNDLKKESMNLRFQRHIAEFKQTHRFKEIRKLIAQILTVMQERKTK